MSRAAALGAKSFLVLISFFSVLVFVFLFLFFFFNVFFNMQPFELEFLTTSICCFHAAGTIKNKRHYLVDPCHVRKKLGVYITMFRSVVVHGKQENLMS